MGVISCRRCAGQCCCSGESGDNVVQRVDCGIYMFALEDEWREKAQDGIAGTVDDDAAFHHSGSHFGSELGRVELDAKHEAKPANLDDAVVLLLERFELAAEV